ALYLLSAPQPARKVMVNAVRRTLHALGFPTAIIIHTVPPIVLSPVALPLDNRVMRLYNPPTAPSNLVADCLCRHSANSYQMRTVATDKRTPGLSSSHV